jgi:hypothetical protein
LVKKEEVAVKSSKWLRKLSLALLLLLLAAIPSAAQEGGRDRDPTTLARLLRDARQAGQTDAVWRGFSPSEQAALARSIILTDTHIDVNTRTVGSKADEECSEVEVVLTQKAAVLGEVWKYSQVIEWCYDGTLITEFFRDSYGETLFPFFEYRPDDEIVVEKGGFGKKKYRARAQGLFVITAPVVGDLWYFTPWIQQKVRGDGAHSEKFGGIQ